MDKITLYSLIGKNIAEIRGLQGITQNDLAKEVGLYRSSITNLEHGNQGIPLHTLYNIAEALNIDVHKLLPDSNFRNYTSAINQRNIKKVIQSAQDFISSMESILEKYEQY